MPNWCYGYVEAKGKKEDLINFCKLFIFEEQVGIKRGDYFARSFIHQSWKSFKKEYLTDKDIKKDDIWDIAFSLDFAWSGYSCLIEGYPNEIKKCITLKDACKKFKVSVDIKTEEQGLGFEEHITCNNKGKLTNDCIEMPEYKCKKCGKKNMFPTSYDISEEECWECGTIGKFKLIQSKK